MTRPRDDRPGPGASAHQRAEPDLLLMGLRGSGKTTIGRALAALESRRFLDLDELTPRELSSPDVARAFADHGEPAFRAAEVLALARILDEQWGPEPGRVIALGGGTPTAPGAADLLQARERTGRIVLVYLRCPAGELRRRLMLPEAARHAAQRPSLTGAPMLDEIEEVFARRDPLYQRLATRVVEGPGTLADALSALAGWASWGRPVGGDADQAARE